MPIKIKLIKEIKREFKRRVLERKIKTYQAHIKTEYKKGAGPQSTKILTLQSYLRDCESELAQLE